jgi:hypothetical protein
MFDRKTECATVRGTETIPGVTSPARAEVRLPLWLTAKEAETLAMLIFSSPLTGGPQEDDLFRRLGDFRGDFLPRKGRTIRRYRARARHRSFA